MQVSLGEIYEFFSVIHLINREVSFCVSKHASQVGLSVEEIQSLWLITFSPAKTIAQLAKMTGRSKEQVRETVEWLEDEGLIQRSCISNSRCVVFQTTVRGEDFLSRVRRCMEGPCRWRSALERVSKQDYERFLKVLHQLLGDMVSEEHGQWISITAERISKT